MPRRIPRRGLSLTAAAWALLLVGALATTAAVFTPRALRAAGSPPEAIRARVPEHQQIAELIGRIIGGGREVLALHRRGPTPYLEIVLWVEDGRTEDAIDLDEVAVLSHSRVMQTLTWFVLETPAEGVRVPAIERAQIDPAFCRQWRDRDDVDARVVATGLSDLRVERTALDDGRPGPLRIFFTWASDSTDGADEASILVDVVMSQQMES